MKKIHKATLTEKNINTNFSTGKSFFLFLKKHDLISKNFALIVCLLTILCCFGCDDQEKEEGNKPVLLADREAPIGWVYLNIYEDHSFNFILTGLRDKTEYPGTCRLNGDTIFFTYKDSIPKAGKTAIISKNSVTYIDGDYQESVIIKLNKLTK